MKKLLKILFVSGMIMCFMVVVASAGNIELDADDNAQLIGSQYEYVDFFIPDGETEQIDPSILDTLAENDTFTEDEMPIELNGLHKTEPGFMELCTTSELLALLGRSEENTYLGLQGGCYDGEYYYYAFIVKETIENINGKVIGGKEIDLCIVCLTRNTDGSFSIIALKSELLGILQHANDMTYNENTGEIIIACYKDDGQKVYSIDAEELQYVSSNKNFTEHNLSCQITSIAYNKTRNQYVVAVKAENTKIKNYMAILDGYYLYRPDVDLWYYRKPDGKNAWLKEGTDEANESTKYLRTCNSSGVGSLKGTAPIGETLILVAQWS